MNYRLLGNKSKVLNEGDEKILVFATRFVGPFAGNGYVVPVKDRVLDDIEESSSEDEDLTPVSTDTLDEEHPERPECVPGSSHDSKDDDLNCAVSAGSLLSDGLPNDSTKTVQKIFKFAASADLNHKITDKEGRDDAHSDKDAWSVETTTENTNQNEIEMQQRRKEGKKEIKPGEDNLINFEKIGDTASITPAVEVVENADTLSEHRPDDVHKKILLNSHSNQNTAGVDNLHERLRLNTIFKFVPTILRDGIQYSSRFNSTGCSEDERPSGILDVGEDEETSGNSNQLLYWKCYLCCYLNEKNLDECKHCSRPMHPEWLYFDKGREEVCVGTRVIIRGERVHKIGVITGIDCYKKTITVNLLVTKADETIELIPSTFSHTEIQKMEKLPIKSPYHEKMDNRGICENCQKTYLVLNGDAFKRSAEKRKKMKQERRALREKLFHELYLKRELVSRKETTSVLECTKRIKILQDDLNEVSKRLEPLQEGCPHCGWPDFDSDQFASKEKQKAEEAAAAAVAASRSIRRQKMKKHKA